MDLTTWTFSPEELTSNANLVKEVIVSALESEGLLLRPASEICERYAVLHVKRGLLGRIYDILRKEKEDVRLYKVVKIV
jgi:hypothetical protein